ncbi:MAG: signal peptidase I [Pirellulales bacterium]
MSASAENLANAAPTAPGQSGLRRRNPWVAAALALFFGTAALVYCGKLRRALAWDLAFFPLLILIGCLLLYLSYGRTALLATALLALAYRLGVFVDAVRIARQRQPKHRWYQRWWFYALYLILLELVIFGFVQLSRTYWEEAFFFPVGNMQPTLLAGDYILVEKLLYRSQPSRHADVIVHRIDNNDAHFDPAMAPPGRLHHAKRVIGIPGDTIEFRNEKLIRNGIEIDEPYATFLPMSAPLHPKLRDTAPITVGLGELFVAGDNRRNCLDSRIVGCIRREDVVGQVVLVYWSQEMTNLDRVAPPLQEPPSATPPGRIRWERMGLRVR